MTRLGWRMHAKNILAGVPGLARFAQNRIFRGAVPTGGYDLDDLSHHLEDWKRQLQITQLDPAEGQRQHILVVGYLKWWLEYGTALSLLLAGRGHAVTLGFVPYRKWDLDNNAFDSQRQSACIEDALSSILDLVKVQNLSHSSTSELPEDLQTQIEAVARTDVQYSRQRETLYLEKGSVDDSLYELRYHRNLDTATATYAYLRQNPCDVVVIPNGSIFEFAVIFRVARYLGIDVVTYEFGEQRERIWMARNDEVMQQNTADLWQQRGHIALTEAELARIKSLYQARRGGELWANFGRKWQSAQQSGQAEVLQELGIDPDKPIALLCTNVVGDSLALDRQLFTDGMVDWLTRVAGYFADHPGFQLVIRVHPGELLGAGDPSVDIVRRALPELPENIFLISPEAKVNTYDLIAVADMGLVYTTTVGMEMAMAGVPVVIGARTHYRNKGFTFDPASVDELTHLTGKILTAPAEYRLSSEKIELAWRYAYRFFFEYALPFPWHIVDFEHDIKQRPLSEVLSAAGMKKYKRAIDVFSGYPVVWEDPKDSTGRETLE